MLPALLLAAVSPAAPVPKDFDAPAKKVERLFGKALQSPKATGEFKFDAKGLTAKMPADKFGNEASPVLGMHTQTLVSGDFEAEVSMRVVPPPLAQRSIFLGGGLFAREPDKKTNVGALVAQSLRGRVPAKGMAGWVRETVALVDGNDDYLDDDEVPVDPTAPFHLRLTRKGNTFATAVSTDGKAWRPLKPMAMKLPDTVGVGVFCYNRTGEPADAVFERFAIRPLK